MARHFREAGTKLPLSSENEFAVRRWATTVIHCAWDAMMSIEREQGSGPRSESRGCQIYTVEKGPVEGSRRLCSIQVPDLRLTMSTTRWSGARTRSFVTRWDLLCLLLSETQSGTQRYTLHSCACGSLDTAVLSTRRIDPSREDDTLAPSIPADPGMQ